MSIGNFRHGHNGKGRRSPEYRSWAHMKGRCENPESDRYAYYGGRGIRVCERWQSFENFLVDMGPRPAGHTLDREDNDGDYEPGNCRWATQSEQGKNRRQLPTMFVGLDDLPITWKEMAHVLAMHRDALRSHFASAGIQPIRPYGV